MDYIYSRPVEYQTEFQIDQCAKWLVKQRRIKNYPNSRAYLKLLQYNHPWKFKSIMYEYYSVLNPQPSLKKRSINTYHTDVPNIYDGEPHMKFALKRKLKI